MLVQDIAGHIRAEAAKVLVGQEEPFTHLLIALFSGGHVLLEGVPGTAKTLMAKTLAALTQAEFKRVQFTPDLMPSDVIGTQVFEMGSGQFRLQRGPRPRARCWRPWRSARSRSMASGCHCPSRSSCWRLRTRSSTRAPTRCRK